MYSLGKTSALSPITMQIVKSPRKISAENPKSFFFHCRFLSRFHLSFLQLIDAFDFFVRLTQKSRVSLEKTFGCHEKRKHMRLPTAHQTQNGGTVPPSARAVGPHLDRLKTSAITRSLTLFNHVHADIIKSQ